MTKSKSVMNYDGRLLRHILDPEDPTLSRSSKLHRKRGYLCGVGACPNCMMRVNDEPNVKVCQYGGRGRCTVAVQNDLGLVDSVGLINALHPLISVGFQYRRFISRRAGRLFYSVLKRLSGLGYAASPLSANAKRVKLAPELVVIGGGVAGLAAASTAEESEIVLLESSDRLGGDFAARWSRSPLGEVASEMRSLEGLVGKALASGKIRIVKAAAVGYYRIDGLLLAVGDDGGSVYEISPRKVVVATGGHETLPPFRNNDSPRVMLSVAAQLALQQGVRLPEPVSVVDLNGQGPLVAADLTRRGMSVVALSRPGTFLPEEDELCARQGVGAIPKSVVDSLRGDGTLTLSTEGRVRRVRSKMTIICGRYQPNYEIGLQLGCSLVVKNKTVEMRVEGTRGVRPQVCAVGALVGYTSFSDCMASGSRGSKDAGIVLDVTPDEYVQRAAAKRRLDAFACICEDVSVNEVVRAIESGYSDIEQLKRYTGAATGPCQGKQCALTVASIISLLGKPPFFTTVRQPTAPVRLSTLVTEG